MMAKEARTRWRSLAILGILTIIWAATTIGAVAGARRTASVVDRFQIATSASHATFGVTGDTSGDALQQALSSSPEVVMSDVLWSAGTGLAFDGGLFVNIMAGRDGIWGYEFDRPIVESGRLADPSDPLEVTITPGVADLLDVDVGDHLAIPTWDKQDWEAWLLVRGAYPAFDGPLVDVVVVGVVRMSSGLENNTEANLVIVTTPAFLVQFGPAIGNNDSQVAVQLRDPERGIAGLTAALTATLAEQVTASSADDIYAANLRGATQTLSGGVVVLAVAVGLTGALVVGFGVAREVRAMAYRYQPLRALGATPRQRAIVLSAPIGLTAIGATMVSVIVAGFASALFPIGSGRLAEPEPGALIDVPVLACSALVIMFMLTVAAYSALQPVPNRRVGNQGVRHGRAVFSRLEPAAAVGYANAFNRRWSRATFFACGITIAGLTGSGWFAQSLDDLGDQPDRWGFTWSSSPDLGFAASEYPSALRALVANPSVEGVSLLESASALIGDRTVEISTFRRYGGPVAGPRLLTGRLPFEGAEVALGERTARMLGADVGDTVRIAQYGADSVEWQVVGLVVPPNLLTTRNPGDGAFTTENNFDEVFTPSYAKLVITYRQGVEQQLVESQLNADPGWVFGARSHARQPAAVANFVGVSVVIVWMGGFFLVLGFAATMMSIRRDSSQYRDLATLRAIGFAPRDVRRSLVAETITVVLIGLGSGTAVGLIAGRVAWQFSTRDLGVAGAQPYPLLVLVVVVILAGAGGILASVLSIRQASSKEARLGSIDA